MVEAKLDNAILKATTPSPGGYFSVLPTELKFDSPGVSQESPTTPTIHSKFPGNIDGDTLAPDFVHGDAREAMPESSKPDPAKAASPSHRRRSRSQLANAQRQSGQHPSQPPPTHGYAISSPENIHSRPPTNFQGSSMHYASPTVPYSQRGGYVGQYTMSGQPSPMTMTHSPPPYTFSQSYPHPIVPDNNSMVSPTIHANYQTMLQPHAPVFPYQHHSLESAHPPFSGTQNSPLYPPHQSSSSPAPPHLPSPSGQITPSYVGPSPFHSLQYPTSMSQTPYGYQTQTYTSSPMYQAQFAPSQFGQHYTPPGETEPQPQGTWYYLPHLAPGPSPQQYDPGPSYQGHYTVGYPQVGHSGMEGPYPAAGPSSSASPSRASPPYPISPTQLHSSRYSDNQTPSDSPRASGAGPPSHVVITPAPSASSSGGRQPITDKPDRPVVRRSYHPNPPAHRSEWVMWAGNVPSDASHDELWRFFNEPREHGAADADRDATTGVLSIFLISRSSCAFVNYENEPLLQQAITRFNGVPLRSRDPRCPRLVCRVRRKDDDLKAGVGGQRGMGMHTRWIREQEGKGKELASDHSDLSTSDDPSASPTSVSERLANVISNVSMSSDEDGRAGVDVRHSSGSGSTNSSFLARYFPKRYFILKSLTQEDLDISVERNVWATQKHNQEILDQAFRTSKEVQLIFSVNKSGEFYGHARMAGPVRRGEQRVSWASRPPQSSPASRMPGHILTANRFVDNSPQPVDNAPGTAGKQVPKPSAGPSNLRHSAPALLGQGYHLPTLKTPSAKHSLDQARRFQVDLRGVSGQEGFGLDPSAPARAMRTNQGTSSTSSGSGSGPGPDGQEKIGTRSAGPSLHVVEEEEARVDGSVVEDEGENQALDRGKMREEEPWGDSFAVEWICTDRLPFHRTKHLRNPWNHDREIKISRDGTELEPTVGQRLLDEWESLSDPPLPPSMGAGRPTGGKRATGSKIVSPQVPDTDFGRGTK